MQVLFKGKILHEAYLDLSKYLSSNTYKHSSIHFCINQIRIFEIEMANRKQL